MNILLYNNFECFFLVQSAMSHICVQNYISNPLSYWHIWCLKKKTLHNCVCNVQNNTSYCACTLSTYKLHVRCVSCEKAQIKWHIHHIAFQIHIILVSTIFKSCSPPPSLKWFILQCISMAQTIPLLEFVMLLLNNCFV